MNDEKNNKIYEIKSKDNRLKNFIERIESLEEEKYNIFAVIKEIYSKAQSLGYKPKVMRKILTIRKINANERLEQEALLDAYKNALGIF